MESELPVPLLFPRYLEKKIKEKTLAFYREETIITEAFVEYTCRDFDTFVHLVFQYNLLTFIESFVGFPYLPALIEQGKVHCTEKGDAISAFLRGAKNTTRWIIQAKSWDYATVGLSMLAELRKVYQHCGVGVYNTPGALGQATIRKVYKDTYGELWKLHRHARPAEIACLDFAEHGTGARSDLIQPGTQPSVWEIDQKNGHMANMKKLATGPTYRIISGCDVNDYQVFWVRAQVAISQPLMLGPFPVRIVEKDGTSYPTYPTQPGTYDAWIWSWEYQEALSQGCQLKVIEGWGWKDTTDDLAPWVDFMSMLRDSAPPEIEGHIKHVIVAAIGRWGMSSGKYTLVEEDKREENDTAYSHAGICYDWFIHFEADYFPQSMPHWYNQISSQCRFMLYQLALPYARSEHLLATNTDAIFVHAHADVSQFKDKAEISVTGEYRKRMLTEVNLPHLRHVISREKVAQPGKKRKKGTD